MMVFNPVYIQKSNDGEAQLFGNGFPNQKPTYLFSDIIKVILAKADQPVDAAGQVIGGESGSVSETDSSDNPLLISDAEVELFEQLMKLNFANLNQETLQDEKSAETFMVMNSLKMYLKGLTNRVESTPKEGKAFEIDKSDLLVVLNIIAGNIFDKKDITIGENDFNMELKDLIKEVEGYIKQFNNKVDQKIVIERDDFTVELKPQKNGKIAVEIIDQKETNTKEFKVNKELLAELPEVKSVEKEASINQLKQSTTSQTPQLVGVDNSKASYEILPLANEKAPLNVKVPSDKKVEIKENHVKIDSASKEIIATGKEKDLNSLAQTTKKSDVIIEKIKVSGNEPKFQTNETKETAKIVGGNPQAKAAGDNENVKSVSNEKPVEVKEFFNGKIKIEVVNVNENSSKNSTSIKAEAPKVETPKVETPKVETPKVETPKVETPKVETTKVETPKVETPKVEATKVEATKVETPKVETTKVEAPKVEAPKVEAPKVEAPKVEAVKVEVVKANVSTDFQPKVLNIQGTEPVAKQNNNVVAEVLKFNNAFDNQSINHVETTDNDKVKDQPQVPNKQVGDTKADANTLLKKEPVENEQVIQKNIPIKNEAQKPVDIKNTAQAANDIKTGEVKIESTTSNNLNQTVEYVAVDNKSTTENINKNNADSEKAVINKDKSLKAVASNKETDQQKPDSQNQNTFDRAAVNINKVNQYGKEIKETVKVVEQSRLMSEIENAVKNGDRKLVKLNLYPEELGSVRISLDVNDKVVTARIEVTNDTVKQMILTQADSLKSSLTQNGIELASLNVSVNNSEEKNSQQGKMKRKEGSSNKKIVMKDVQKGVKGKDLGYNTYDYIV